MLLAGRRQQRRQRKGEQQEQEQEQEQEQQEQEQEQEQDPRFIVNVSAMEGKFYRYKTPNHPHTNMAKAALNMMTRTSAGYFQKQSERFMPADDRKKLNYGGFTQIGSGQRQKDLRCARCMVGQEPEGRRDLYEQRRHGEL